MSENVATLETKQPEAFEIEHGSYDLEDDSNSKLQGNYVVYLINMSQLCLRIARVNNGGWFPIPLICRNCSADYNTCFKNHQWAPVVNVQCNDAVFNLSIATEPDENGHASGATWRIQPSCDVSGGVIGLD